MLPAFFAGRASAQIHGRNGSSAHLGTSGKPSAPPVTGTTPAGEHHHHHHQGGVPIVVGFGPWWPGPYGYGYPVFAAGPVLMPPPVVTVFPFINDQMFLPQNAPNIANQPMRPVGNAAPRPRPHDTTRGKELTELGDRLFRAGNLPRAVERYEQAIRANPDRAEPRARLAFVALARGKYQDAANKLREALTAEPGWLANAGDLQSVFREPAVFDEHVAKLEAHLQAKPEDRDAWLVLGSIWYFSGRTQKAADIFLRLSDRLEDTTLRAFQLATKAKTADDQ
jgi:hypothetical protein